MPEHSIASLLTRFTNLGEEKLIVPIAVAGLQFWGLEYSSADVESALESLDG